MYSSRTFTLKSENTGRNLSEIQPSSNLFALTIIFRHNWACPQGFWNICYLIGNVENGLAILPPMKCSRNSRHCKNDSSTVHKWGKLKMKKTEENIFHDESVALILKWRNLSQTGKIGSGKNKKYFFSYWA